MSMIVKRAVRLCINKYVILLSLVLSLSLVMPVEFARAKGVVVIVNNANETDELSFDELSKIFKMEKQYWDNGKKIYVLLPGEGTQEKIIALEKIYKMNGGELKKFLLQKIFQGEITAFPKTLSSNRAVKHFIRNIPEAIGIIGVKDADDSIKILRIGGKTSDVNAF